MLPLAYGLAWIPALAAAFALRPAPVSGVLTAAGPAGIFGGGGLGLTLIVLTAAYLGALRRPPSLSVLVASAAVSLAGALAMPLLFSADAYAYASYGDLALHGQNPYGHDAAAAPRDALTAAAIAAWDGHIPPRCVYGPVAVAIAAAADAGAALGGPRFQLFAQRLAAVAAYAICVAMWLRLVRGRRARAAFALNPVVLWSVAEGHNDAAMLGLILGACALPRWRPLLFAAATAVKAPALAAWAGVRSAKAARGSDIIAAAAVVVAYLPLGLALAHDRGMPLQAGGTAVWDSPLGLLAGGVGRIPAAAVAAVLLAAAAVGVRHLPRLERAAAFALAAWFLLPNAYPWYALWIVPLAARNLTPVWSRALVAAALASPVRAISDAVFGASDTIHGASALHPGMIALEFLPPLLVLGTSVRFRRTAAALVAILAVTTAGPVRAQSTAPSPQPAPPPTPPAPVTPGPAPSASVSPASAGPATPTPPQAQALPTPGSAASAAPAPGAIPSPAANPAPATPAVSAPLPASPAPPPAATPSPFTYIINPTPVPVTSPDGPHIIQVELNDRRIRAGGPLVVRVFTSANVVGVEARALGRFIPIPQNSPGFFALAYTMPGGIPFWLLNRTYDIVIAAATADGRQTSVSFPMLLTR